MASKSNIDKNVEHPENMTCLIGKSINNQFSLKGSLAHVNVWSTSLPSNTINALSLGASNVLGNLVNMQELKLRGAVEANIRTIVYTPRRLRKQFMYFRGSHQNHGNLQ